MAETKPMAADPSISDAIRAEEDTRKVFVGNLPYQTTEEQLAQLFGQAGKVERTQIVSRFKKSKGYGFVVYASTQEADTAAAQLNAVQLEGREIKVERARPKQEGDASRSYRPSLRNARPAGTGAARRSPRHSATFEGEEAKESKPISNGVRIRDAAARAPRSEPEGVPSKTMLFVSNLPYTTTDEDFAAFFKGYTVVKAYVSRYGRMNRSRGYGFVELATEDEQKRALAAPEMVIDGRSLKIDAAKERTVQV